MITNEWICRPLMRSLLLAHACSKPMHVLRFFAGGGYRRLDREEEEKLVDRESFPLRTLEKIVLFI